MEATALSADYAHVARSCARLRDQLNAAAAARVGFSNGDVLTLDLRFREAHVCFADSNFFSFFPYTWLRGDKNTALREVNSVVISAPAVLGG